MSSAISDNLKNQPLTSIPAKWVETSIWVALLFLCNYPLVHSSVAESLIFFPDRFVSGEWYRIVLAPFAHVSWYHLGLDAAAFLMLWHGLQESRCMGRITYFAGCWAGSMLVPLAVSSQIYTLGLCGLSGIAHGLFAITALEMITSRENMTTVKLGVALIAGLLIKVAWELFSSGEVMMAMHVGDVGVPIVSSHLGGILGGGIAFTVISLVRKYRPVS